MILLLTWLKFALDKKTLQVEDNSSRRCYFEMAEINLRSMSSFAFESNGSSPI